ncbi:MAG: hypothetical protein D6B25_13685 [Desulfobulbaceae bacterium]|nr:MAG: hypothetical protein D6B25_13685 [Desulfobulbaceae bacterium]
MAQDIFECLCDSFVSGVAERELSYYFSLDGLKKTVKLSADGCTVEDGRTVENADCVCKSSVEFFEKIWLEDYRPGMGDFLSGKIKSNDPNLLQTFLKCFGKPA